MTAGHVTRKARHSDLNSYIDDDPNEDIRIFLNWGPLWYRCGFNKQCRFSDKSGEGREPQISSIYRAPAGIEIRNANTKEAANCFAVHRTGQVRLHLHIAYAALRAYVSVNVILYTRIMNRWRKTCEHFVWTPPPPTPKSGSLFVAVKPKPKNIFAWLPCSYFISHKDIYFKKIHIFRRYITYLLT